MPLVSVIIPTYNNPLELIRALNSVVAQSYNNIEVLIINDGSSVDYDLVKKFIENNTSEKKLYYYDKINEGPGLSRQFGLEKSKGKFIQYLDSDDEILPHKILLQVKKFKENPEAIMIYGLSMINGDVNKIHRKKHKKLAIDELVRSTLEVRKWHTSSCLWKYPNDIKCWFSLYNGEDVMHDFIIGVEVGKLVLFIDNIVTNVNFSDSLMHLSNASKDKSKLDRVINDVIKLNNSIEKILIDKKLLIKAYKEPFSERLFYISMRLKVWGKNKDASLMLNKSMKLTESKLKILEIIILKLLFKIPIKNNLFLFRFFFKIHRKINNSKVHQYRYI